MLRLRISDLRVYESAHNQMIYQTEPQNFNPRFQIVSCYSEEGGEILMLHRHENKSQGGKWGLPAGKMEQGESEQEAMVRELKEETGLIIPPERLGYFDKLYVNHAGRDFIYHMFSAKLSARPPVTINDYEHQAYQWIAPQKALSLNLIDDLDACIKLFYS